MFDPLIHRQDGEITGAAEAAMAEQAFQIGQDPIVAIGERPHAVNEVRPRQVEHPAWHGLALVVEERIGLVAEELDQFRIHGFGFRLTFVFRLVATLWQAIRTLEPSLRGQRFCPSWHADTWPGY